jgi:hypothetical protein
VRLRAVLIGTLVVFLLVGVGIYLVVQKFAQDLPVPTPIARACNVKTASGSVLLDPTQMANAATIAAVGIRRKVPDRALVVALAAALQESKLENLDGGDRDSVGLFQQRPSQGWGDPDQILDPRYSSRKFFDALLRVRGWEAMRVTEAAQRVQRSAYPEAYEKWAADAMVLTEALTGRAAGAVNCTLVGEPEARGVAAATALGEGLTLDWGVSAEPTSDVPGLALDPTDLLAGWQFAHWLVAHSEQRSVQRVRFGDLEWTAKTGTWGKTTSGATDRVVAEVYTS